jgi:hypothetical protein
MLFQDPLSMGEGGDNLFENVAANDFLELGRGVGADQLVPFFHIDFQTNHELHPPPFVFILTF